jgi:hypothetical protein
MNCKDLISYQMVLLLSHQTGCLKKQHKIRGNRGGITSLYVDGVKYT